MKKTRALIAILVFAGIAFVVTPMFGTRLISPLAIFDPNTAPGIMDIFWQIRLPRVVLAFLSGAGLALSGLAFQAIFQNPLATPFTLGVSSGASLGAAAYVRFGLPFSLFGISGVSIASFLGALLAIVIVYGLTLMKRGMSTTTMLLAGVAVSFSFTSMILFMQYTADLRSSFEIVRWLMGGLEAVGFDSALNVLPFVLIGSVIILGLSNELNLVSVGEDLAASRGVDVRHVRKIVFFAASLMVGGVVATCGPIGFIGMMAPHICRLLIGWEHRFIVPATIAFGGAFLAVCDSVARTVITPVEIPVGVVTAMIGGPFFIWLLMSGNPERSLLGDKH